MPGPLQLLFSLPEKSYGLSLFLKCNLFPEVSADFLYKRDLSFLAQSLSQCERGGLTFPLLACMYHDCPRLCLPCALLYFEFLGQYLTYKYVLSKCKTSTYWTYCQSPLHSGKNEWDIICLLEHREKSRRKIFFNSSLENILPIF